ncbi:MAG: hypothetical protein HOO67_05450 [Candidatus Peribacteraceae bacterium]|nr:hypothetical protein [Candidatus Peribacteraceae bacterium]
MQIAVYTSDGIRADDVLSRRIIISVENRYGPVAEKIQAMKGEPLAVFIRGHYYTLRCEVDTLPKPLTSP